MSNSLPGNDSLGKIDDWVHQVVAKQSLHEAARIEEDKHKWIQSQKAGYDLGKVYPRGKEHWTGYLRARWVEHLQGKCFWIELEHRDFNFFNANSTTTKTSSIPSPINSRPAKKT